MSANLNLCKLTFSFKSIFSLDATGCLQAAICAGPALCTPRFGAQPPQGFPHPCPCPY